MLWSSGRVESDESLYIPWGGPELGSRDLVWWRVKLWDADGQPTEWSQVACFELGLLEPGDWSADWVCSELVGGRAASVPVPYLRKAFVAQEAPVKARLYLSCLGIVDATVNGVPVSGAVFAPGWSDYRSRVRAMTVDVTDQVRPGENVLGAVLGDGWACGHIAWFGRQVYVDRPMLLAQLELTYPDGTVQVVGSDETWTWNTGPIVESDFLMGEHYEQGLERAGWDQPGFDDSAWRKVLRADAPVLEVEPFVGPFVEEHELIEPIKDPVKHGDGWIFDLGQNLAGVVRLKLNGKPGQTIRLRHAEVLNPDGSLYLANLRAARATDQLTIAREGELVWQPRFTFHGFRYVELRGLVEPPTRDVVTGVVLHSKMDRVGSFACSHPLVNQLQSNIWWGQKGNFIDVPTDCPQRDERLGWTGDAQVFCSTALFNAEVTVFFRNWMRSMSDAEGANPGKFPTYAPEVAPINREVSAHWPNAQEGGPAWADAGVIVPWTVWKRTGDIRIIEENWDSMVRFVDWLESESKGLIRCYPGYAWRGFGDWLNIDAPTSQDLIGTAFLAYSARLMAEMAAALGRPEAGRLADLAERAKAAFQERYVSPLGLVVDRSQTAYLLALHFDLLPEKSRQTALVELANDIRGRGTKLSAGFVGSSYLPFVLSEGGQVDLAFALLFQQRWPSWLYAVTKGATTIWERWDGWTEEKGFQDPGMNSFNHYAYGAVGSWLYERVAGLGFDPAVPAGKVLSLRPIVGHGLSTATAELDTPYGRASSTWSIEGDRVTWKVVVPANCTARLRPEGAREWTWAGSPLPEVLPSGSHTLVGTL